ncbi:hypothetical protein MRX96_015900 [Rhipicephalus microplus]
MPTAATKLRQFLVMVDFYPRFIKNHEDILAVLDRLFTSKGNKTSLLPWGDTAEDAFIKIKGALALAHAYRTASLALMSYTAISQPLEQFSSSGLTFHGNV